MVALAFFTLGFVVHQPKTIGAIRNHIVTTSGLGTPTVEDRPHVDNRAMRVRVLNELMKERYPPG